MTDTNLTQLLIQTMARVNGASSNMPLIVTMILSAFAPLVASVAAYFMARAAKENTENSKRAAETTQEEVKKIHIAVNSERTQLLDKLAAKDALILEMVKSKASDELARSKKKEVK